MRSRYTVRARVVLRWSGSGMRRSRISELVCVAPDNTEKRCESFAQPSATESVSHGATAVNSRQRSAGKTSSPHRRRKSSGVAGFVVRRPAIVVLS